MNLKNAHGLWLPGNGWQAAPRFGSITIEPRRVIEGKFKFMNFPSIKEQEE
jgi:hypothetical protein